MNEDFAVFILTHGRPNKVKTYDSLLAGGYTGRIFIVIDNEDKSAPEYYRIFGDKVIQFDKSAIALTFDEGDNFGDRRAVIYARNACFQIARDLGIPYFMELDDDYLSFRYRMNNRFEAIQARYSIRNLDVIFDAMLDYYREIPARSIAMAQGGDYIGGLDNHLDIKLNQRRKAMNTFILSPEREFQFIGRINEDVNSYTRLQNLGALFMMIPFISIDQVETQQNSGGMTEMYLDSGTYIKSFYTVMYSPSSVKVAMMWSRHPRIHHHISWINTVPYILPETYRKVNSEDV